jgi:hypothetical protein
MGQRALEQIAESKHMLLVLVTQVTGGDILATHGIVSDTVCTMRKEEWFRKILQKLIPYLKSHGTLESDGNVEMLMNDFAERHTLSGMKRTPAHVQTDDIPPTLRAEAERARPIIALINEGDKLAKSRQYFEAMKRYTDASTKGAHAGLKTVDALSPTMSDMLLDRISFGMAMANRGEGDRKAARKMLQKIKDKQVMKASALALEAKMDAEDGAYVESTGHYLDALDTVLESLPTIKEAYNAGLDFGVKDIRQFVAAIVSEMAESTGSAGERGNTISEEMTHRISKHTNAPLLNYAFTWIARVMREQHLLSNEDADVIAAQVTNAWAHEPVDYKRMTSSMRQLAEQVIQDPALIGGPIPLVAQILAKATR